MIFFGLSVAQVSPTPKVSRFLFSIYLSFQSLLSYKIYEDFGPKFVRKFFWILVWFFLLLGCLGTEKIREDSPLRNSVAFAHMRMQCGSIFDWSYRVPLDRMWRQVFQQDIRFHIQ